LTIREVNAVADRLSSCGISKLATDAHEQARDLRITARLLWLFGPERATRIVSVVGSKEMVAHVRTHGSNLLVTFESDREEPEQYLATTGDLAAK
jgi:aspartokinase